MDTIYILTIILLILAIFMIIKKKDYQMKLLIDGIENSSKEFDTILNSTIEGIVLIEDGFIYDVNKALITMLDYKNKEELIGNLATGFIMPASTKFLEYNNNIFQEVTLLTKDSKMVPAVINIKDITLGKKSLKMASISNLSEIKSKENMMLKQSRMAAMGEMISMIAHQWRQPLGALSAAMGNIRIKVVKDNLTNEFLEHKLIEMGDYIQYMSKTIDDFRNFFKADKERKRVYLSNVVENSIKMIAPGLKTSDVRIEFNKADLPPIVSYENELIQVFLNIIKNAEDALSEKENPNKYIKIDFIDNENEQVVTFKDNAGGIKPDIINDIFEPYFSTKKNQNGTGLGLYMCKIIIEQNCGGKIFVNNIEDGACFSVVLYK